MTLKEIANRIDFIISRIDYMPSTAGKELVTLRNQILAAELKQRRKVEPVE